MNFQKTQLKEQAEFKFSNDMDLNAVKKLSGGRQGARFGLPSVAAQRHC
jgi:hypothetical protein